MEYGKIIKEKFKPTVDENLANEIEERVKNMNKRRKRVVRKRNENEK
jgi:hypothetical protein